MPERAEAMRGNRSSQQHPGSEDAKFRGNPVSFRAAGQFDANVLVNPSSARRAAAPSAIEPTHGALRQLPVRPSGNAGRVGSASGIPLAVVGGDGGGEKAPLFMVDVKGFDALPNTSFEPPQLRSPSPAPSDSSQDVVVFRGRNRASALESKSVGLGGMAKGPSSTFGDPTRQGATQGIGAVGRTGQCELADSDSDLMQLNSPDGDTKSPALLQKTIASSASRIKLDLPSRNRPRSYPRPGVFESNDDGLDDYAMNVLQHAEDEDAVDEGVAEESVIETVDVKRITVEQRGVEATADEDLLIFSPALDAHHATNNLSVVIEKRIIEGSVYGADVSVDALLESLEVDQDASPLDDRVNTAIERILDKRVRRGVVQYLVVWRGGTADEAQWKRKDSLTSPHATQLIRRFEAESERPGKHGVNKKAPRATMSTDSDERDSGDDSDDEIEDDVGSNRGDDPDWEVSDDEDEEAINVVAKAMKAGLVDMGDAATRVTRSGRVFARALDSPSDLIGLESPKTRKKGSRRSLPFELSDPELEERLTKAWTKDRKKKSEYKQHRQELREQGLLGKKSKSKASGTWGNGTGQQSGPYHEIRLRIRSFVMSPDQELRTPPMAKFQRLLAHRICAAYFLNSKSHGAGDKRYTQISKTPRSLALANNEAAMRDIDRRFGHRDESTMTNTVTAYSERRSSSYRNGNATASRSRTTVATMKKSTGGYGAASYRDGDVVGASAPEIGTDNRGRAMLEKMGWSKGTALGAQDNKGILQPVAHVVKTSKAGLG